MDREKVIKGLEICTGVTDDCAGHTCPYWDHDDSEVSCRTQMELDAYELLKKQKFFVDESGKITPLPVVVRFKDCKFQADAGRRYPECDKHFLLAKDDWFCADGERR